MLSLLTRVSITLSLLGIAIASVLEPRNNDRPIWFVDFQCDHEVFTGKFLFEAAKKVKSLDRYSWFHQEKLSKMYDGPPFSKPYLVWPISHKTSSYSKAMSGPYRMLLKRVNKNDFEVFSVVVKKPQGIQECIASEPVAKDHVKYNFKCGNHDIPRFLLLSAARSACPDINRIATQKFPARYDGPHFAELGLQRYVYPINLNKPYRHGSNPGPYRVVINSACKIVGAVTIYEHGEVFPCAQVMNSDL